MQKVAVTEKTEACEIMLAEISTGTKVATEKKTLAVEKGKEIEEQSKEIAVQKVKSRAYKSIYQSLEFTQTSCVFNSAATIFEEVRSFTAPISEFSSKRLKFGLCKTFTNSQYHTTSQQIQFTPIYKTCFLC